MTVPNAETAPAEGEPAEAPGETAPGETESTDTSIADLVADESADLSSTGLPDKTIAEIKRLRNETKQYRQTAEEWGTATKGWNPADLEQLRTALAYGADSPEEIGRWMYEQGQSLLGIDESAGEPAGGGEESPADEGKSADEQGLLTPEQVQELINKALEERDTKSQEQKDIEARIETIKGKTQELGFGPSHVLHEALLSTARFKFDGDLDKAAEALIESGARPDLNDTESTPPAEAGTPVPPEGATPAGTQTLRDPKAAALERLNKVLPENKRGFADL